MKEMKFDCIVCHECRTTFTTEKYHKHDCKEEKLKKVRKRIDEIYENKNCVLEHIGELEFLLMREKELMGEPVKFNDKEKIVEHTDTDDGDGYTRLFKALIGR